MKIITLDAKCSICETAKRLIPTKHLPLHGRVGHITLSEWTMYCRDCREKESERLTKEMDELIARHIHKEESEAKA